ncbi:oligomeric Golgi complex subunit 7 [Panaeolus papilionaceus]|nr:oligomeric Golgi complex subunit 7 [Panaeolus papilionaceus]
MAIPATTTQLVDSIEQFDDTVSWVNDILSPNADDEADLPATDLVVLDNHITQLLTALDLASEDTSSQLERIIDDVSRGIPRLAYDLHFMKDGASTLQASLVGVLQRSKDAIPKETSAALDELHHLDLVKGRMEAAREVLREAESWSTLEHEVTTLITEKSYGKAAERLSEASKSMVVFQNTPEYDPRRTLMVNLQNQLEAALSTALISAINSQDWPVCKDYFSIFSVIQREPEFRNYYYGSRRTAVITFWQKAVLSDCNELPPTSGDQHSQTLPDFLPRFYANFLSLVNTERISISSIFPDPSMTLSQFISSTLAALQPTMPHRLSSFSSHHGDLSLAQLIPILRATEEFAINVEKVMEKIRYSSIPAVTTRPNPAEKPQSHRRKSSRMSISLRPGQHRPPTINLVSNIAETLESMEWDQELFQPFIEFQVDYATLEKKYLEQSLHEIIANDSRDKIQSIDRPRLFRERAIDIFGVADGSMGRCQNFTHGYGASGLVQTLDSFFQSFVDSWTAEIQSESSNRSSLLKNALSQMELADLDYSAEDWSKIQVALHLLGSARAVFDRLATFETKLRSYLSQIAAQFRLFSSDPLNFMTAPTKGETQLLEQSALNSTELHSLLISIDQDPVPRELQTPFSATFRNQAPAPPTSPEPLLVNSRQALSNFAQMCQQSTSSTILAPLRNHLTGYASSPVWRSQVDPSITISSNELRVPTFSLSPSETVQRIAEGLLNLPRLFEVYAHDEALAFSLQTLPHVEPETLQHLSDQSPEMTSHRRRPSLVRTSGIDSEIVSSAWLSSLGHTFLEYLTSDILPSIPALSLAGAAQLASDLEYLSNIVRALNVEHTALEKWKVYTSMNDEAGLKALQDMHAESNGNSVLEHVGKLRGWC